MVMRHKAAWKLAAVIVPAVIVPAASADVGATGLERTVLSISSSVPAFHGKVKSDKQRCKAGRVVKLYRKDSGGDAKRLGTDRSAASGRWEVPVGNLRSGAYFAKAKPKRGAGCAGARSETVVID